MTTDENDTILDPFLGTGTSAIAAKKMGRHYIGIDIDQEYVELAKQKVNQAHPTQINGCYVSIFLNRIQTLRDKDYEKVKSMLKTSNLKINGETFKQLTLPYRLTDDDRTKQTTLPAIEIHL
jgi:site-specific DNA-methyltransferase (adenine-specific)